MLTHKVKLPRPKYQLFNHSKLLQQFQEARNRWYRKMFVFYIKANMLTTRNQIASELHIRQEYFMA